VESAHRLVWNALTVAHATAAARRAVGQAREHDALSEVAATVGRDLDTLDEHLDRIGDYLHQAAWLTQAWAHKLDRVQQREALRTELAGVAVGSLTDEVSAALALSEATFASLTAARDVLDAGPFAWEQEQSRAA
jgi:hypothetical protein